MNNTLLEFIKNLSLKDTKKLSEKTLKLFEEGGELSEAVLAFLNADGSRHKVFQKKNILEECADAILVALSIAYSLGYDDDAINSMMYDKAIYWSSLKELDKSDGRYPFEIHLTLEGKRASVDSLEHTCQKIGNVKPIILDLYTKEGIQGQTTTSSAYYGDASGAFDYMGRLVNQFNSEGWRVTREKIETVPWHPMTVKHKNDGKNYFESHLTFIVTDEEKPTIDHYCDLYGVRLSRNALKHDVEGLIKFMGTIRTHESKEAHEIRLNYILQYLANNNIVPSKIVTEYAYYDSNEKIDNVWIK
jgi:NTP pyrophosphatase (non-canonical NTP hydrolase)